MMGDGSSNYSPFFPEQKFQMNKILMCEINKSREEEETRKKFDVQERGRSEKNFLRKVRKKRAMEWWERGENHLQEGRKDSFHIFLPKEGYMKSTCVPSFLADSFGCRRDFLSSAPLCFPVTSFLCRCLAHSQSFCSLPSSPHSLMKFSRLESPHKLYQTLFPCFWYIHSFLHLLLLQDLHKQWLLHGMVQGVLQRH